MWSYAQVQVEIYVIEKIWRLDFLVMHKRVATVKKSLKTLTLKCFEFWYPNRKVFYAVKVCFKYIEQVCGFLLKEAIRINDDIDINDCLINWAVKICGIYLGNSSVKYGHLISILLPWTSINNTFQIVWRIVITKYFYVAFSWLKSV